MQLHTEELRDLFQVLFWVAIIIATLIVTHRSVRPQTITICDANYNNPKSLMVGDRVWLRSSLDGSGLHDDMTRAQHVTIVAIHGQGSLKVRIVGPGGAIVVHDHVQAGDVCNEQIRCVSGTDVARHAGPRAVA